MPIPKSEGEAYIKEYIRLQNELLQLEGFLQAEDVNMKNYHSAGLISFIFKKDRIDALFQYENDANALRIYYGAHSNGDPTLVLVPCQVSEDETSVINKLAGTGDRVEQHPKPKTSSGGFALAGFDLENDPI